MLIKGCSNIPEKSTGSCGMMDICDLNCSKLKAPVSIPSMIISPSISAILNNDPISDDFPAYKKLIA